MVVKMVDDWMGSPLGKQVHRRKCLKSVAKEAKDDGLHKTLTAYSLISLGIGSVIGAGIFVLTGQAAAKYAGPALSLSFIISAFACFFTGLCYAELASTIPIAGSAYSYVYVSVGEGFAWAVGLCLTLEYMFSAAAVAVGWGAGLQELLREWNMHLPEKFSHSPLVIIDDELQWSGSYINVPSMLIIAALAVLLSIGVKESARFNNFAVATKIGVLTTFVGYGIYYAMYETEQFEDNLDPFIPPNEGKFGKFGVSGIFRGAGAIFFAYVGFDAVCAVAQECKNPEEDLPKGLMGTLVICTIFYIFVTLALTGLMDYRLLNVDSPVIEALYHVHAPKLFRYLVEVGTIAGLTSVCLVSLMSMPRVVYAIANDGLLPRRLADVHPKFKTPMNATILTGVLCCFITGTFPLDFLGELISFGTLLAFTMVCVGVLMLRRNHPDHPRPFSTPLMPYIPAGGIITCLIQLFSLPPATWRNCLFLMLCGMAYYFFYARFHSRLHIVTHDDELNASITVPGWSLEMDYEEERHVEISQTLEHALTDDGTSPTLPAKHTAAVDGDESQKEHTAVEIEPKPESASTKDDTKSTPKKAKKSKKAADADVADLRSEAEPTPSASTTVEVELEARSTPKKQKKQTPPPQQESPRATDVDASAETSSPPAESPQKDSPAPEGQGKKKRNNRKKGGRGGGGGRGQ